MALIELLAIVLVGTLLVVVLMRVFGKPAGGAGSVPEVKLVRTARTPDGREETRLLMNDTVILTASNDGVRLAEYADDVEQLEAVAARLATSLGVTVEFTASDPARPATDTGIPVRDLPPLEERRSRHASAARLDDAQEQASAKALTSPACLRKATRSRCPALPKCRAPMAPADRREVPGTDRNRTCLTAA